MQPEPARRSPGAVVPDGDRPARPGRAVRVPRRRHQQQRADDLHGRQRHPHRSRSRAAEALRRFVPMFELMRELFQILQRCAAAPRIDRLRSERGRGHHRRRRRSRGDHRAPAQRRAPADRGVHAPRERDGGLVSRGAGRRRRCIAFTRSRTSSRWRSSRSSSPGSATASARRRPTLRPRHFQKLLERIHGKPEEKPIAFLMLRTMQKARYAPENLGHFGLAASSYTHFTSPIRRYPDLVVHRALRAARHARAERGNPRRAGGGAA